MHPHLLVLTTAASLLRAPGAQAEPALALRLDEPVRVERAALAERDSLAPRTRTNRSQVAKVESALHVLALQVELQSHPDALRLAFHAYFNFRTAYPELVRNPYLYYVDYGLDNETPRGYVFDMDALKVVEGPFTVAHGRGSAGDGVPLRFSNTSGSYATSLGLFLTEESYDFTGNSGGASYQSIGLRLRGLSGRFNSAALERHVVAHGAPYVTPTRAGRSEGCPAMEPDRARRLIPRIANGGLVFLFSPYDSIWMSQDPWAHAE